MVIAQHKPSSSPATWILVVALLIGGAVFFVYNKSQSDRQQQDRIALDRDIQFRKFLTKAYLMRTQVPNQDAWNKWLISEGYRPCITCNGRGQAEGAACTRCATFGVEPRQ